MEWAGGSQSGLGGERGGNRSSCVRAAVVVAVVKSSVLRACAVVGVGGCSKGGRQRQCFVEPCNLSSGAGCEGSNVSPTQSLDQTSYRKTLMLTKKRQTTVFVGYAHHDSAPRRGGVDWLCLTAQTHAGRRGHCGSSGTNNQLAHDIVRLVFPSMRNVRPSIATTRNSQGSHMSCCC